jgi:hypothetical protein
MLLWMADVELNDIANREMTVHQGYQQWIDAWLQRKSEQDPLSRTT